MKNSDHSGTDKQKPLDGLGLEDCGVDMQL